MNSDLFHWILSVGLSVVLCIVTADAQKSEAYKPKPGETVVRMTIEGKGDIYIRLAMKEAPNTAGNFLKLVKKKFYDGILFHRVVPDFVAQAGDPQTKKYTSKQLAGMSDNERAAAGIGGGGPGYTIKFEPNPLKHERGSLGMARTPDPDSAGSQFYICLKPQPRLDGQYVVFGKVMQGMEIVDKIQVGDKIKEARVIQEAGSKEKK